MRIKHSFTVFSVATILVLTVLVAVACRRSRVVPAVDAIPARPNYADATQWYVMERNAPVAVTTNGNRRDKPGYLYGYDAMLERLDPSAILCLGKPFPEMRGPVVYVPYDYFGREVGDGRQ